MSAAFCIRSSALKSFPTPLPVILRELTALDFPINRHRPDPIPDQARVLQGLQSRCVKMQPAQRDSNGGLPGSMSRPRSPRRSLSACSRHHFEFRQNGQAEPGDLNAHIAPAVTTSEPSLQAQPSRKKKPHRAAALYAYPHERPRLWRYATKRRLFFSSLSGNGREADKGDQTCLPHTKSADLARLRPPWRGTATSPPLCLTTP